MSQNLSSMNNKQTNKHKNSMKEKTRQQEVKVHHFEDSTHLFQKFFALLVSCETVGKSKEFFKRFSNLQHYSIVTDGVPKIS